MDVRESWDAEYRRGRYKGEPPVDFVNDIVEQSRRCSLSKGLYIDCGNGRNYVPLVESGLDLIGLDSSEVAIDELGQRVPDHQERLVCGDISYLPPGSSFEIVVGIQVFQFGTRAETHEHIRSALALVSPGGLFCIRVNSSNTEVHPAHEVIETALDGGFTVRYTEGPKKGFPFTSSRPPSWSHSWVHDSSPCSPFAPIAAIASRRSSEVGRSWRRSGVGRRAHRAAA